MSKIKKLISMTLATVICLSCLLTSSFTANAASTYNYKFDGDGDKITWKSNSSSNVAYLKVPTNWGLWGSIDIDVSGTDKDGYMILCDSNKNPISDKVYFSEDATNGHFCKFAIKALKSYYIKVGNIKGTTKFKLNYSGSDAEEINGTKLLAYNITKRSPWEGYVDGKEINWYKFKLSKKQAVDVEVHGYLNSNNLKIQLIDSDGDVIKSTTLKTDTKKYQLNSVLFNDVKLSKGTYYVKVASCSEKTNARLGIEVEM